MSSRRLGTGGNFGVDVSVEILHVIHINLNNCIGFNESKHPSEHKSNALNKGLSSHF